MNKQHIISLHWFIHNSLKNNIYLIIGCSDTITFRIIHILTVNCKSLISVFACTFSGFRFREENILGVDQTNLLYWWKSSWTRIVFVSDTYYRHDFLSEELSIYKEIGSFLYQFMWSERCLRWITRSNSSSFFICNGPNRKKANKMVFFQHARKTTQFHQQLMLVYTIHFTPFF